MTSLFVLFQVYSISPSFVSRVMIQIVSAVVEEMARLIECVTAFGADGALQVGPNFKIASHLACHSFCKDVLCCHLFPAFCPGWPYKLKCINSCTFYSYFEILIQMALLTGYTPIFCTPISTANPLIVLYLGISSLNLNSSGLLCKNFEVPG